MDIIDIEKITYDYYSHWTGLKMDAQKRGVFLNYYPERDLVPKGYSQSMDVFVFSTVHLSVVSYGNKAKEKIENIADKLKENQNIDFLAPLLKEAFSTNVNRNIKYIYKKRMDSNIKAAILNACHYELFFAFFTQGWPKNGDTSWVKEYFLEKSSRNYIHGIIIENKLVSATDAPDMPYMSNLVQEIGINTLPEYRGKGYARSACISLINELLSKNICPLWSTGNDNTASDRLARSTGFEKLADVLSLHASG
ncbi:MAG: GNAT family N-acetyltransferase [Treponema sp.]|jgi:hypothetical protein|nr:GNAT family N-acetyltransferase [Treponema sp.]